MAGEIIFFVVISLVVSVSQADQCRGAFGGDWVYSESIGRCFRYISTPMSWTDAQRYCSHLGFAGSLAFLNNQEVSEFARTAVTNAASEWIWLGISDDGHEGTWKSADGEPTEQQPFRAGQPDNAGGNEHYVHINVDTWDWNDVPVTSEYPFMCQAEPADEDSIRCPLNWQQHGHLCYKYIDSQLDWYSAQDRCALMGNEGSLAFVGSEQDNNNVFDTTGTDGDFWIGITDLCHEGKWTSPYGKDALYLNWRPNEPNDLSGEDCVHMTVVDRQWNDLPCRTHTRPFVCQKSARFSRRRCPSGDGWVQRGENCYQYVQERGTWEEASSECRQLGPGGMLPFIGTEEQNNEVYEAAAMSAGGECVDNFKNFWIGITDHIVDNTWTNPDGVGSLASFAAWGPGEPNDGGLLGSEGYVEMIVGSKTWNDENGSEDAYVCRLTAEPACNPICPEMWTAYDGSCYLYNGNRVTHDTAKEECEVVGAILVSHLAQGGDEHRFLGNYIAMASGGVTGRRRRVTAWIDLVQKPHEGVFVWSDESEFDGIVDESSGMMKKRNCVVITGGEIIHENCFNPRAFVCKKSQM